MDYTKKLTTHRELYPIANLDYSVESDRGRIISAPALRRLQKRTQVFALELNAAVRSRLTHSLEVAQSARYIAKTILQNTKQKELRTLENAFVSTAEMASLLHDIGNPPFGHFGEMVINNWMRTQGIHYFCPQINAQNNALKTILIEDICNFDGNAQAIRIVTKLQRLNLSYTQIASILKYTRGAYEAKPAKTEKLCYIQKKPGFYYSEKEQVQKVLQALEIKKGHRFPITYIMEAADDISYLNADMEDAVDKGILRFDDVYSLIKQECEALGESYLLELVQEFYDKAKAKEEEPYQFNLFLTLTRAKLTTPLVQHVANLYLQNHEAIFEGSFNQALLEADQESKYTKAIQVLQNISIKHIYNSKEVQEMELQGHAILTGLFEGFSPLLQLSQEEFLRLSEGKNISCFLSMRLIKRLSSKHIVAYKHAVAALDKNDQESFMLQEWYYRARLLIDYISGMTDDFALNEYRAFKAL